MINQSTFNKASKKFDKLEKRTKFFALASKMMKKRLEIEAYLLILSTWNTARFRIFLKEFDIEAFRNTMVDLNKHFRKLKRKSIRSSDLTAHAKTISTIFDTLTAIKGVEYTGASKVMHLKNPKLFVMWDDYIRGGKPYKRYQTLPIVKKHQWFPRRYPKTAEGYLCFLRDMQCGFSYLRSPSKLKTLAKAIDEFNYVNITLKMM